MTITIAGFLFPSPYGDCGSYRLKSARGKIRYDNKVSVPLRGLWFLSLLPKPRKQGRAKVVSVPLRGLWFLSPWTPWLRVRCSARFPSPYGDCGSYDTNDYTENEVLSMFPSPYGDCGSYRLIIIGLTSKIFKNVSVPLRGLWFLSWNVINTNTCAGTCSFRPLTGIVVLINGLYLRK